MEVGLIFSPSTINEFKELYLKEYGINLSNKQAIELGTKLIRLVRVVYGSNLPKKWKPRVDRSKHKELGLK